MNKTSYNCAIQPQPQMNEIAALNSLISFPYLIPDKLLIVGDRGFEKYALFALLNECDVKYLIRVKQEHGTMTLVRHLPMQELDTDVSGTITTSQTLRGNIESGDRLMHLISKFVEPIRPDRSDKP